MAEHRQPAPASWTALKQVTPSRGWLLLAEPELVLPRHWLTRAQQALAAQPQAVAAEPWPDAVADREQYLRGSGLTALIERDAPPPLALVDLQRLHDACVPLSTVASDLLGLADASDSTLPYPGLDPQPVELHLIHDWGGGIHEWVHTLAETDPEAIHLLLRSVSDPSRQLHGVAHQLHIGSPRSPACAHYPRLTPIANVGLGDAQYRLMLEQIVARFGVVRIVISSLVGHDLGALELPLPTVYFAHDYFPTTPNLGLGFGADEDPAQHWQASAPPLAFESPARWQRVREQLVTRLAASQIPCIAPSASVMRNYARLDERSRGWNWQLLGHPLRPFASAPGPAPARSADGVLKVLVLGNVAGAKGLDLVLELARARHPRLRFVIVGLREAHLALGHAQLDVIAHYDRDQLPDLIATLRPDLALIPSQVAETFSYVLSELRALGLPVLASARGALTDRIRDGVDGFLVEPKAAAVMARLESLAADAQLLEQVRARLAAGPMEPTPEHWLGRWRSLLPLPDFAAPSAPLRQAAPVDAARQHLQRQLDLAEHKRRTLDAKLEALTIEVDRRGRWGHELERTLDARTRWAKSLEQSLEQLRSALTTLQAEFDERSAWALDLQAGLEQARGEALALGTELAATTAKAEADHQLLNATRNELGHVQGVLRDREHDIAALLNSTSWKLTRPLRALAHRYKRLRTRFALALGQLRMLGERSVHSLRTRGILATIARARTYLHRQQAPVLAPRPPPDPTQPIVFAPTAAPKVSVVIPVYGQLEYTLACLRSLAQSQLPAEVEILVIDDHPGEPTAAAIDQASSGVRLLANPTNLGFLRSCNRAAEAARGSILVLLNNDTTVTPGWLQPLVERLEGDAGIGLVGAKLVYPDGRLQEAGGIVFSDGSGWNYGRFEDPADPRYNFAREVDYCSGACIALRRAQFLALGGFDERYVPAYYEDTDLAFALRAQGLKVLYEPRSEVIHHEGISSGTDLNSGIKQHQVLNQHHFVAKWATVLAQQSPADPRRVMDAARRGLRGRILIIDATLPMPDQDSGSVRMLNLLRCLLNLGWQPTIAAENRAYLNGYVAPLQALGVEVLYHPYLDWPRFFDERGASFQVVMLSRHYVASAFMRTVRDYCPRAQVWFDTVDLHYLREQRQAEVEQSPRLAEQAAKTRAQELAIARSSDLTLVVSPVEVAELARAAPEARCVVLSNIHEVAGCRRPYADRHDLWFIGGFQHLPNVDAALWLKLEIWPLIAEQLPGVCCHIVGSRMPEQILALASDDFRVHGQVADLAPFLDGCRLLIAPLRYGAGVKGKVNQAMAYGQPVVGTSMAVEGMHLVDGEHCRVADDAAALAAAAVQLYRDEGLWQRLSMAGLANVEAHFSRAAAERQLAALLDKA